MSNYRSFTEAKLIDLLKSGDKYAFAEIYDRYWQLLIDMAYQRLNSIEAAEEVVQDIFVSFFVKRYELSLSSTLEAYLKTAVKYKVYNVYRSQQVHYDQLGAFVRENHIDPLKPDTVLETKELKARVLLTVDKMPEKCREVFILSRFEHLSHQEIAAQMEISVSTVKKHITKAIKIMRTEFQSHQIDLLAIGIFIYIYR